MTRVADHPYPVDFDLRALPEAATATQFVATHMTAASTRRVCRTSKTLLSTTITITTTTIIIIIDVTFAVFLYKAS